MIPEKTFKSILKKLKSPLTDKELKESNKNAKIQDKTLQNYLFDEKILDEAEIYEILGKLAKTPFAELKGREIKKEILNMIPGPFANTHEVVAFGMDKDELKIAMTDPTDIQTIEFLRRKTGLEQKVYITSPSDMKDAMRRYHAELEDDLKVIQEQGEDEEEDDGSVLKKQAEEVSIINIVNTILEHAVYEGASDIHIEPSETDMTIRYRVDGILKQVMTLPKNTQSGITARIKILSNLKIDEHMIPQDGRFKIKVQNEKLAFRVSILPVYDGEKIVMRLLHEGTKALGLDELGFLEKQKNIVETAIKKPHGIILVTGPTGSGKTTTLYSILGILNQPDVNISTVEDPIEYRMKGVNQSQIKPKVGFTFASGLRALLRQDPNIIMVGEIRDQETAEIAINAAMTGHLVLSTLHTNDAPTSLPRLLDMGVPPFLVAFTANIIVAQRLVRKICPHCKKEYKLDEKASKELSKVFETNKMKKLFSENIKNTSKTGDMVFYKGEGCRRCGQSGYKGRLGIYEVLEVTEKITKKINSRANADEIKEEAKAEGMITVLEDGLIKAKMGITTIAEILRVIQE